MMRSQATQEALAQHEALQDATAATSGVPSGSVYVARSGEA